MVLVKKIISENGFDRVEEIHRVVVHRFSVSDTDDPEIYAAQPIWEWENSDAGKFVMTNSLTVPVFHKSFDYMTLGCRFAITAELDKKKYSEFLLRFGKDGNH